MNATKLNEKTKILLKFFGIMTLACSMAGCDTLESDPDVLEPQTELTGDEIYVLANNASFIDLNSKIKTNVPARIAITSETRNGELTDLGKGILQYSPEVGNSAARDGFEFTVYTTSNQIIKRDSVIIIIQNDSTDLPCNIYPIPDYAYGVDDEPVLIDVLANDVICGGDVTVSIFKPANGFPPLKGQAEVVGNKVKYTPGSKFENDDKVIYKLSDATDTSRTAYGIVYIRGDSACNFRLNNDSYVYSEHDADSLLDLPVFANDSLCKPLNAYQVNLKSLPAQGQVTRLANGYRYQAPASITYPFAVHFEYEACLDASCKSARVDIKLKKDSVATCLLLARRDSINIAYNDIPLMHFAVLHNDSICGDLTSFKITKAPLYGTSEVVDRSISYQRDPLQNKDDSLEYEICTATGCSRATVLIKRTK
jgi:hypothetical protein